MERAVGRWGQRQLQSPGEGGTREHERGPRHEGQGRGLIRIAEVLIESSMPFLRTRGPRRGHLE